MRDTRFLIVSIALLTFASLASGCARWSPTNESTTTSKLNLPKSRMSENGVAMEIAVAQLDHLQAVNFEAFVRETDPLKFSLDIRQRLDRNGFRVSVLRDSTTLNELLLPRPLDTTNLSEFDQKLFELGMLKPAPRLQMHRRIEKQHGEPYPVSVSAVHPVASWTLHKIESSKAYTVNDAKGVIKVTPFRNNDGTAKLVFAPEVHFGDSRSRIGIVEKNFAFKDGQSVLPIPELNFEITIRPGETVLVAPTKELGDLGELFFGDSNSLAELIVEENDATTDSHAAALEEFFPMLAEKEEASVAEAAPPIEKPKSTGTLGMLDDLTNEIAEAQANVNGKKSPAALAMERLEQELETGKHGDLADLDAFADQLARDSGFTDDQDQEKFDPNAPRPLHRFMLVRLLETQSDDLFGTANVLEKLSSSSIE